MTKSQEMPTPKLGFGSLGFVRDLGFGHWRFFIAVFLPYACFNIEIIGTAAYMKEMAVIKSNSGIRLIRYSTSVAATMHNPITVMIETGGRPGNRLLTCMIIE